MSQIFTKFNNLNVSQKREVSQSPVKGHHRRESTDAKGQKAASPPDQKDKSKAKNIPKEIKQIQVSVPVDYYYKKLLGEGAFGRVRLCVEPPHDESQPLQTVNELKTLGDTSTPSSVVDLKTEPDEVTMKKKKKEFAVKIQSKFQLIKAKQVPHTFNEVSIWATLDHPFILKLNEAAQDKRSVYLYTQVCKAGTIMDVLNKVTRMHVDLARFYIAQIVSCFEYMHDSNIIYRDLKPENVLVTNTGYVKLADFGFVKKLQQWERTYTFCGTPEYIAPEIIQHKGYSFPVDWYACGIMMYEILYGRPPFMANDPYEIFKMVTSEKIKFPRDFDKDAKSLIKHLTAHDLSLRLGNLKGGIEDVKNHRFFKSIDWAELNSQRMKPLYIPKIEKEKEDRGVPLRMIEEQNDNLKFPPIKEDKDPFLTWF